jgi:hypothetical protein
MSFLSGVECIMEVVTSWEVLLNAGNTAQFLSRAPGNIHAILTCIHNMSGTNSFMTMTINRCLDYTKATQGFRLVPKHETLPLRPVLEMPMKMMSDVQQAIEIRLLPWDPVICTHVVTDKQWLLENMLCLLSNAVKYSLRGHADIGVRLRDSNGEDVADPEPILLRRTCSYMPSVEDPEVLLQFEVQDTGIGLSEEAIQMLFNPFKQAQRMAGGTGLGLFSLAKRVEALHGQYGVCSRPDGQQGSLFWFAIPYRPDYLSAELARTAGDNYAAPSANESASDRFVLHVPDIPERPLPPSAPLVPAAPSFNVLVVDDAPLIVRMTTMLLTRKGHRVSTAVNGADALERILAGYREGSLDLLVRMVA